MIQSAIVHCQIAVFSVITAAHMRITALILYISSVWITSADPIISGINYGDDRDTVTAKLRSSEDVKSDIPETMLSRVGLNGSFKTAYNLKGQKFLLYFNWADADALDELTFRSQAYGNSSYDSSLKSLWNSAIKLISGIHGFADKEGEYPAKNLLQEGGIRYSHEWKISEGFIYLGTAKENGEVHLVITFSQKQLAG